VAKKKQKRKTITFSMEKEAYKVAKKVYDKKIAIDEGVNELQKKCWNKDTDESFWNENAAKDYIDDFRYLVDDRTRTWKRIVKHILYYLSQIYNDDKNDKTNRYEKALSAFKKHNDYLRNEKDESIPNHELLYKELKKNNKLLENVYQYYKKNDDYFTEKELKQYIRSTYDQDENTPDLKSPTLKNSEITKYLNNQVISELVKYLNMVLPNIADKWWEKTVFNKLTDLQLKNVKNKKITSLEGLDLAALLRVFDQNWYEISSQFNFTKQERNILKEMQSVRDRWAHVPDEGYKEDDIYRDLDTTQRFLKLINADQRLIDELQGRKLDFLPKKNH
jgi:hypothetical protein